MFYKKNIKLRIIKNNLQQVKIHQKKNRIVYEIERNVLDRTKTKNHIKRNILAANKTRDKIHRGTFSPGTKLSASVFTSKTNNNFPTNFCRTRASVKKKS